MVKRSSYGNVGAFVRLNRKWAMKVKRANLGVKIGSIRLLKRFAWLPLFIGDDLIWLERYEVLQGYIGQQYQLSIENKPVTFTVADWITLSKRVMK